MNTTRVVTTSDGRRIRFEGEPITMVQKFGAAGGAIFGPPVELALAPDAAPAASTSEDLREAWRGLLTEVKAWSDAHPADAPTQLAAEPGASAPDDDAAPTGEDLLDGATALVEHARARGDAMSLSEAIELLTSPEWER